jgi:hypothetical protein
MRRAQQEWLTFVVVVAGPTGVELAGALAAQSALKIAFMNDSPLRVGRRAPQATPLGKCLRNKFRTSTWVECLNPDQRGRFVPSCSAFSSSRLPR